MGQPVQAILENPFKLHSINTLLRNCKKIDNMTDLRTIFSGYTSSVLNTLYSFYSKFMRCVYHKTYLFARKLLKIQI